MESRLGQEPVARLRRWLTLLAIWLGSTFNFKWLAWLASKKAIPKQCKHAIHQIPVTWSSGPSACGPLGQHVDLCWLSERMIWKSHRKMACFDGFSWYFRKIGSLRCHELCEKLPVLKGSTNCCWHHLPMLIAKKVPIVPEKSNDCASKSCWQPFLPNS